MARLTIAAGHSVSSLHNRQAHIHIAAGGVRARTYLVRLCDQGFRFRLGEAGQRDGEVDIEAKTAFRTRSDTDSGGHRGVRGDLRAALRSDAFHRADEAGGITGRKQLLGIVAGATAAAEFLRSGELDVERAVEGS